MTREEARTALGDRNNLLWEMSKEEQKYYSEALDMAISALSDSNVGMSMSHRAIAKVIDDYIANHKGDSDKQYTAFEIKALLISDDSAENKGEWIPVSERLPKPYEQVLRTVKSIGWNSTSHIYVDLGTICPADTDVIAWQPLPEPYKKGE